MRIEYSKDAAKYLQRMEKQKRQHIHEAILGLTVTPPKGKGSQRGAISSE